MNNSKRVATSKNPTQFQTSRTLFQNNMIKIYPLFQTKKALKTYIHVFFLYMFNFFVFVRPFYCRKD